VLYQVDDGQLRGYVNDKGVQTPAKGQCVDR
jgi:hypothetical protein